MNNITPIRQYVSPQNFPAQPQQQDWWVDQGCGPPQCGPPSCFSQIAKANECWDQSQSLYNLIMKVVMDIFEKCPGIIPSPPPGSNPGITDGSSAAPGQIGEVLTSTIQGTFTNASQNTAAISALVLSPGDWDVQASLLCVVALTTGCFFYLNPLPTGMTGNMSAVSGSIAATGGPDEVANTLVSPVTRANVTVPTLLPFTVIFNLEGPSTGQPTGTYFFTTFARRVR